MTRRLITLLLLIAAAGGSAAMPAPSGAAAEFENPQVISASSRLLGAAESVALSSDGRFAFFVSRSVGIVLDTSPAGITRTGAMYRRDLETGELEVVVYRKVSGTVRTPASLPADEGTPALIATGELPNAAQISTSADGRFVAFTTSQSLVAGDPPRQARYDVYVRDMARPLSDPAAFTLASALNGTDTAPTYFLNGIEGSAAGRNAISADGTQVAFTAVAESNIAGTARTAGQAVVRDLSSKRTRIVSTDRVTGGPAKLQDFGLPGGRNKTELSVQISADGTVVTWLAGNPFPQLPYFVQADLQAASSLSGNQRYAGATVPHLLWRQVSPGEMGPTRLVVAGADPDDPACLPTEPLTDAVAPGVCDGPLGRTYSSPYVVSSSMSADGSTVAVAAQPNRASRAGSGNEADLYLVDMAAGLSRKQAARRITVGASAGTASNVAATDATGLTLAPDASWLVFTATNWDAFSTPPFPVGEFPVGVAGARLYAVDLAANTIQLLGRGYDGSAPNGGAIQPVISNTGRRVAFLTEATNFFWGDTDGATNAVLLTKPLPPENPPVVVPLTPEVPARTLSEELPIDWRISATGKTLADGTVRMTVTVPSAGQVTVTPRRHVAAVTSSRRRARTQPKVGLPVTSPVSGTGVFTLTVRPNAKYRKAARTKKGLKATATVVFTPDGSSGKPPLTRTLTITFKRTAATSPAQGAAR